jgi:hypothetical protein
VDPVVGKMTIASLGQEMSGWENNPEDVRNGPEIQKAMGPTRGAGSRPVGARAAVGIPGVVRLLGPAALFATGAEGRRMELEGTAGGQPDCSP